MPSILRSLPFSSSTTAAQAITYLLGISLFSISFLVFLNSSISFVVTDLIGQKDGVGDAVGTLGFADEVVALIACPAWGVISDRLGVRWVAVIGYSIIAISLGLFVQAKNVYPQLLLARLLFALGASAAATMVTAILPSLSNDSDDSRPIASVSSGVEPSAQNHSRSKASRSSGHSFAFSMESEATITPERYTRTISHERLPFSQAQAVEESPQSKKSSALAGLVGLFTGCGALVALVLFLPLPAQFGEIKGITTGQAVTYSFYVVSIVSLFVAVFVAVGLRNIKGEAGKGWKKLFGLRSNDDHILDEIRNANTDGNQHADTTPYLDLLRDSVVLGLADSDIALGYLGGFVARASTVAISLFFPLYINTFFMDQGFCQGSPHDPSPELKKECRSAYVLSSILTGVAQLIGLICAPVFGYLSNRSRTINYPIVVATSLGIIGYTIFPQLASPEIRNIDERGGSPAVFVLAACVGISQIGAIVCSLGSLSQGILSVDSSKTAISREQPPLAPADDESAEDEPLMHTRSGNQFGSRIHLKGSIAGVYSLCGGAAILILTKLGGLLFDTTSKGAPFYMMAGFNGILLVCSLLMDASRTYSHA